MRLRRLTTAIPFAVTILLTHFSPILAQKCYMPDRKTVANQYTSCNTSAVEGTTCCAYGAACLSPCLCYLEWDMSINTGACTDSTWSTKACFQGCPVGQYPCFVVPKPSCPWHRHMRHVVCLLIRLRALPDYESDNVNTLYRCNDNKWCCSLGGNTTSCCNDPNVSLFPIPQVAGGANIFNGSAFAPGYVLRQTTTSTASATGTKPTSTSTSGNTCPTIGSSAVPCPAPSSNNGDTTKVGVGVGVGIGVPLLAALAAVLFLLSREKQRSREFQQQATVAGQQFPWEKPGSAIGTHQRSVHEMPGRLGDDGAKEMLGSEGSREMSAYPTVK